MLSSRKKEIFIAERKNIFAVDKGSFLQDAKRDRGWRKFLVVKICLRVFAENAGENNQKQSL